MSYAEQLEIVARLLTAAGLGALIGFQREFRGHEAGLRTSMLVAVGAAVFGELSRLSGDSRIAAGVVQGIGFIGAGLIFQRGQAVSGITTATTIWVLAGLGLMVAQHLWFAALLLTIAVVVLLELAPLSDWIYRNGRANRRTLPFPSSDVHPPDETGHRSQRKRSEEDEPA